MSENRYYMACLDLAGRSCLVIGAGSVGSEKVGGLLDARAAVTVVAPEASVPVRELAESGRIEWLPRAFEESDLDGRFLAIAATSDAAVNESVYKAAEARSMLVNVADAPALCNFILPAVTRRGELAVAVSTAGASPALAQRMRREAAAAFGEAYEELADVLRALRPWAKSNLESYEARKSFFDDIVNGDPDPIALLARGDRQGLDARIASLQEQAAV